MINLNIERLVRFVETDEPIKKLVRLYAKDISQNHDMVARLKVMVLMQSILVKYKKENKHELFLNPNDRITASAKIIELLKEKDEAH